MSSFVDASAAVELHLVERVTRVGRNVPEGNLHLEARGLLIGTCGNKDVNRFGTKNGVEETF